MKNEADKQEVIVDAALNLSQGKGAYMRHFGTRTLAGLVATLVLSLMSGVLAQVTVDLDYISRHMDVNQGYGYDTSGDGVADSMDYDTNGDGNVDAMWFSTANDGYFDAAMLISPGSYRTYSDTNRNGVFDNAMALQANGTFISQDPEEDGSWTGWVDLNTLGGSPAPSYPVPSEDDWASGNVGVIIQDMLRNINENLP